VFVTGTKAALSHMADGAFQLARDARQAGKARIGNETLASFADLFRWAGEYFERSGSGHSEDAAAHFASAGFGFVRA
jgi:hypothetical protein